MSKETGGPAFQTLNEHQAGNHLWHFEGMTMRDYFASKAISELTRVYSHGNADPLDYADAIAEDAYTIADAMMKARAQ